MHFSLSICALQKLRSMGPTITKEEKPFSIQLQTLFLKMRKQLFLVKKGKQVVGRMAAMINWIEVKEQGKTKVRFGWYDTIDDIEVSRLLLDAVMIGKANRLTYIEGPWVFQIWIKLDYWYKDTSI